MLFINKTMEQRGETVTSANPTETVPSIRHLQFRFQHASLYMHVSSEKKYLSTSTLKKKRKKRSHFQLYSAKGMRPSSCCCSEQELFALSLVGAEMGEFTPEHSLSATAPHVIAYVWVYPGATPGMAIVKQKIFWRLKSGFQVAVFCLLV